MILWFRPRWLFIGALLSFLVWELGKQYNSDIALYSSLVVFAGMAAESTKHIGWMTRHGVDSEEIEEDSEED